MPRFNAWIVAAAVFVAITWWSPEQFEPDQIRRSLDAAAGQMRRSLSRIGDLLREGSIVLDPAYGKPPTGQREGGPGATKD